MHRPAAIPAHPWEVIELAVRIPVVSGIATLQDARTSAVHMPLLTSIEAPPGSVLVCDGVRMGAAAFATQRAPGRSPSMHAPGCASFAHGSEAIPSDVVRGFLETLSPSQVEAMPAFLDWLHYDEVAVQLPEDCGEEAVVVRGLNQKNMMAPRHYAHESAYYKYS